MLSLRRAVALLPVAVLSAGLAFVWQADGQDAAPPPVPPSAPVDPPPPTPVTPTEDYFADSEQYTSAVTLPGDPVLRRKLEAAREYLAEEKWYEASELLQGLLQAKEDVFVPVLRKGADGKRARCWSSVRTEAGRVLAAMPEKGLTYYRQAYGPIAEAQLNEGGPSGDVERWAHVAQCYPATEAGTQALIRVALHYLDRGSPAAAALAFGRLVENQPLELWTTATLAQATAAFRASGDTPHAEQVWQQLRARAGREGLRLGEQAVTLDVLDKEVSRLSRPPSSSHVDWPLFRGDAARSDQGEGGRPFLDAAWRQPTVRGAMTRAWLDDSARKHKERGLPILPASFPIAARAGDGGPVVVYRSFAGIHAVEVHSGKLLWEARSHLGLDQLVSDGQSAIEVWQWAQLHQQFGRTTLPWDNSVIGALSADQERVYAVDDLLFPPLVPSFQGSNVTFGSQALSDAVAHNELLAFEVQSGKLAWRLGGHGAPPARELSDCYFLGPPLPVGGKLYVLIEKNQELRLVCLDPSKNPGRESPIVWSQALADARDRLVQDVDRRVQAVHLAYGEGVLVCPTNAGVVFGIDLLTHELLWARAYRDKEVTAPEPSIGWRRSMPYPGMMSPPSPHAWKTSAPVIQEGKVVFTAPDGGAIHCLSLRDGAPLWTAPRTDDDLYLGCVARGKVVVVTRHSVRSVNLADGKPGWKELATGLPSGQGVAGGKLYYLPLQTAVRTNEPEVCVIDMEQGRIVGHTRSRSQETPGNLLFADGLVVSQTVQEIVAYPQLTSRIQQIDALLAANPADPVGLAERGELRLYEGQTDLAVADLRAALAGPMPRAVQPRMRARLHEAFTELLQRNFLAAEKYLPEYEELSKSEDPAETLRRRAIYLALVGRGRERQGRLADAFEAYSQFGTLADRGELLASLDEPAAPMRADVWARERIASMLATATPEQRGPVEERIQDQLRQVTRSGDLEALRRFVGRFGPQLGAGRQARFLLAQRLVKEARPEAYREAEEYLQQLRRQHEDMALAGRAVERLAWLALERGQLADAAHYGAILNGEFARTMLQDGKTGTDLFNEFMADKRLLPYLE